MEFSVTGAVLLAVLTWISYNVIRSVYSAYFGPLSKIPGPPLSALTILPFIHTLIKGENMIELEKLHRKYGPVVRSAPEEVSFISAQAWQDIYGHKNSRVFVKSRRHYIKPPEGIDSLITDVDPHSHARGRRLLAHAFSEKALQEQESIMKLHVDLLIDQMKAKAGEAVNLMRWYNFATFDIIGDLAFGESFNCLKEEGLHRWVSNIFKSIKAFLYVSIIARFPLFYALLMKMIPASLLETRRYNVRLAREKMERRVALETDRKDFFYYLLRGKDEKAMHQHELAQNSMLLIVAGSETTATCLSGATYYLLKSKDKLGRLQQEIRGAFKQEEEITLTSTGQLKYLNAVLEESLRLYPPAPVTLPRVATEDAFVDGQFIPRGTSVGVSQFAAYRSPTNFHKPDEFRPERWLDEGEGDSKGVLQPFSIGPRNCIGRNLAYSEMRLILTRMVWNFDMGFKMTDREIEDWDPRRQKVHLVWQKPDLMVRLTQRQPGAA